VSDDSAELTDEMAVQHWLRIAADTDNLQNHGPFPVQPGSELADDDAQSDPYQVSHCAQGFLNSGIDHIHAVKTLILGDKPIIHADSDYTLIRGALENLAVAFWVLRPTDRRVRRAKSVNDAASLQAVIGGVWGAETLAPQTQYDSLSSGVVTDNA
jgi:hypothetical protein